jgi:SAM-dependent methyltransferase
LCNWRASRDISKEWIREYLGIDPSPSCSRTAQKLYGIRVKNLPVSEIPDFESPFDLVVLNSVLEHIRDLDDSLKTMKNLLKPGGLIWIEVPDVTRFADLTSVAFQQFSMEHINFFSSISLTNLMQKNGFEVEAIWQNVRQLAAIQDPALSTLYRRNKKISNVSSPSGDSNTRQALLDYLESSYQVDANVLKKIDKIVESGQTIIVWGVGTHTQRLLATSKLNKMNIKAFIDSNPNYQGKTLNNVLIYSPDALANMMEPILISSRLYQDEIAHDIREKLGFRNKIILLY